MNENQFQQKCYTHFHNMYPEQRGCMFMAKNEGTANKSAMGLVRGVSDLHYFTENRTAHIELKVPESRHKVSHLKEQAAWLRKMQKQNRLACFVDTFENFKAIVEFMNLDPEEEDISSREYAKTSLDIENYCDESINYIERLCNTKAKTVLVSFNMQVHG